VPESGWRFSGKLSMPDGPVLLVDDLIDSGWTMTVLAALLRQAGCEKVYPVAINFGEKWMNLTAIAQATLLLTCHFSAGQAHEHQPLSLAEWGWRFG
jgi:hypothetical protein